MKRLLLIILLNSLFAREYIAIIDFEAIGVPESDAKALTQRLTSEMIEIGEYQIVERSEMKRLMEEQKFQYSGCADIKCAVDIGKMIGAKYMVVGGVSKVGRTYSIDSRMISVESGESYISASFNHQGEIDYLLVEGMKSIAYNLCDLEYIPKESISLQSNTIKSNNSKALGAYLSFDSNPQGASIYINDNLIGETPLELIDYPAGIYNIKINKKNYIDENQSVELVPYGKKNIYYELICNELTDCDGICGGENLPLDYCFDENSDGFGDIKTQKKLCENNIPNKFTKNCEKLQGSLTINTNNLDVVEMIILNKETNVKTADIFPKINNIKFTLDEGKYAYEFHIYHLKMFDIKYDVDVSIFHNQNIEIEIDEEIINKKRSNINKKIKNFSISCFFVWIGWGLMPYDI